MTTDATPPPPTQPPQFTPQPMPGRWDQQVVTMSDGTQQVMLAITDAAGQAIRFLDPDTALVVAEQLRQNARTAKRGGSGLIVPPGLLNGNGGLL